MFEDTLDSYEFWNYLCGNWRSIMNLKSMRVRLPLTYAAIALLATLVLGSVLILTLQDYYTKRESENLVERAKAIQIYLSQMMQDGLPADVLQAQLKNLAYFAQARVRFYDQDQHLLADSGEIFNQDVLTVTPLKGPNLVFNADGLSIRSLPSPYPEAGRLPLLPEKIQAMVGNRNIRVVWIAGASPNGISVSSPVTNTFALLSSVPRTVTFNSYGLNADGTDGSRSKQNVVMPVFDAGGSRVGTLELSDSLALGGPIVRSVMRAWVFAGLVAILLAAAAGWLISRQVTYPLTALSQVTQDMASGDLSARADPGATGEFGELGVSFNRMAEQIEGTVGALRKFASDAAHELKTPLTALVTDLELSLEEGILPKEREAYLQRAQGQAERLDRLMDGLLDLSHLEAGPQDNPPIPVDLAGLLREAGENFAAQAEQHDLEFELELPDAPLAVMGYPDQLRRAGANLVDNAVKFTPAGGCVQLQLGVVEGEAEIRVVDSGIGIPEEDLDQVFRRFHRGHNTAAYNGSGLGLAIVQAIVQAHGGRVWAENNPGGGACFTIRLPEA
jgi:signal transduction histidine kinase